MIKQKFKAGDVVSLESGAPLMTVMCVKDGMVTAMWWGKTGENCWAQQPTTGEFPDQVLREGVLPPEK